MGSQIENLKGEHFQIPKTTYNADVETVHNSIEFEFYDIEGFNSREDFFAKATTYCLYYNLLRKNSNRRDKSPLDTLIETKEDIEPAVLTLPALDLDRLLEYRLAPKGFNQQLDKKSSLGGHDVPRMSLYAVEIYDKKGQLVPGYYGLAATGRAGERDLRRGVVVDRLPIVPGGKPFRVFKGFYFENDFWDGSDFL